MESLNSNNVLNEQAVECPPSPILSVSKTNRQKGIKSKLNNRSGTTFFNRFAENEQLDLDSAGLSSENRLANFEHVEQERMRYSNILSNTLSYEAYKVDNIEYIDLAEENYTRNSNSTNIQNYVDQLKKKDYESQKLRTASGKEIKIPEYIVDQSKNILNDTFEDTHTYILKSPSLKFFSRIPVHIATRNLRELSTKDKCYKTEQSPYNKQANFSDVKTKSNNTATHITSNKAINKLYANQQFNEYSTSSIEDFKVKCSNFVEPFSSSNCQDFLHIQSIVPDKPLVAKHPTNDNTVNSINIEKVHSNIHIFNFDEKVININVQDAKNDLGKTAIKVIKSLSTCSNLLEMDDLITEVNKSKQNIHSTGSRSLIQVDIPQNNSLECETRSLHLKKLAQLHDLNMEFKHGVKLNDNKTIFHSHAKADNDFVGFDKHAQTIANNKLVRFVSSFKEIREDISKTQMIIRSTDEEKQKVRGRRNKKCKIDYCDKRMHSSANTCKLHGKKQNEKLQRNQTITSCKDNITEKVCINDEISFLECDPSIVPEQNCKKSKRCENISTTVDKEIIKQSQLIELTPKYKKLKIEIDCNDQYRINICCNSAQSQGLRKINNNACSKGAIDNFNTKVKYNAKNSMGLNKELLHKMKKVDKKDKENEDSLSQTTGENAVSDNFKFISEAKSESSEDERLKLYRGTSPEFIHEFSKKCSNEFLPNSCKSITKNQEEMAIRKDLSMNLPEEENKNEYNDACNPNLKEKSDGYKSRENNTNIVCTNFNYLNNNEKPDASGCNTAQILIERRNEHADVPDKKKYTNHVPFNINLNRNFSGFRCASGRNVKVSSSALERAKKMLNEDSDIGDGFNEKRLLSNMERSGNNYIRPMELSPYQEDTKKLCRGDYEQQYDNEVVESIDTLSNLPKGKDKNATKAFELLKDVVDTVGSTIEKLRKNKSSHLKARQRVGMPKSKQVNILDRKLDKRLYRDETATGGYSFGQIIHANTKLDCNLMAILDSTQPKNDLKLPIKSEITPNEYLNFKKSENKNNITSSSSFVLQSRTPGKMHDWYAALETQINLLKHSLVSLEEKKHYMKRQINGIHCSDNFFRKQREGILYTKKTSNNRKISLKTLEISTRYSNANDVIHKVNLKSVDAVHFNVSNLRNIHATEDGAIIIPNSENLIGLAEVETAFQSMVGVEPDLIPDGWISNHYCLIVWKLASYQKFAPNQLQGCLSIEYLIQQLKYRYDREIDRTERPVIRKFLEKDDVSERRIILCVANIIMIDDKNIELELTDGWYVIRTIVDILLAGEIQKKKIKIGTKLMIYGAQLLNCDGCHPLQVADNIKLKISYNCTRRAMWYTNLGYQRCPGPFLLSLSSIRPGGGIVGSLKLYILRVYPMQYIEDTNNGKVWRNEKAEEKYADTFETERLKKIERIYHHIEQKIQEDISSTRIKKNNHKGPKSYKSDILNIACPKTLHDILESSSDPEFILENLLPSQRIDISKYHEQFSLKREQEISMRISKEREVLKLTERKVCRMLKLLVKDNFRDSNKVVEFCVWNPKEDDFSFLKEGCSFIAFNVVPKFVDKLSSNSKTYFRVDKNSVQSSFKRQISSISLTLNPDNHFFLDEFDTVGLVVQITVNSYNQTVWLTDAAGLMLFITIHESTTSCSLLDGITKGKVVCVVNLIYCTPKNGFGRAIANRFTIITTSPREKYLSEALEIFKSELPENQERLFKECEQNIKKY